jgi:hypothetical protein
LGEGQHGRWRIGPLSLWVARRASEWWIASKAESAQSGHVDVESPSLVPLPEAPEVTVQRIGMSEPGAAIRLQPALADRPVVAHPQVPLQVLPADEVSIYLSTPLWVQIVAVTTGRTLVEIPTYRPSDTWLGPTPVEGELCYASKTSARLTLEDIPLHPIRAQTEVRLRNQSEEPIVLERISIPAPAFSLYLDASGFLWTEPMTVVREAGGATAQVTLGDAPPAVAASAKRLAEPRTRSSRNVLIRAFSALFG